VLGRETSFQPVLQVLEVKRLNASAAGSFFPSLSSSLFFFFFFFFFAPAFFFFFFFCPGGNAPASDRYRMMVSDGSNFLQAMLATQLNQLVQDDLIKPRCLVKLDEFICNTVHDRQIAIVLQLSVVGGPCEQIGHPTSIEAAKTAAPAGAANPPAGGQNSYNKPPSAVAPPYQAPPPQQHQQQQQQQQLVNPSSGNKFQQQGGGGAPQSRPAIAQDQNIFPLSALNPFQNQRWVVRCRVIHKGDVKTWRNERGEGKLCSVDILDSEGSKMRVTMFNNEVDTFEPQLQQGKSYFISKGQIKPANKKFNNLGSDYEMTLDKNSLVESAPDGGEIPLQSFKFVPIAEIANISADKVIDVLGKVIEAGEVTSINTKRGTPLSKRTVTLVDSSMASIELTLWGKFAETVSVDGILAIQGAKVSDWNAKTIGTSMNGSVESNPDLPEAHKLRVWFEANQNNMHSITQLTQQGVRPQQEGREGAGGNFKPAQYKTFAQIRDEGLGKRTEPDYFLLNATVSSIKHDRDVWYHACTTCNKKVVEAAGAGGWVCEKCNSTMQKCAYRYILRVVACDHTGSQWLNAFNDQGEAIMGISAAQLAELKASGDDKYEKAFESALFKELSMKCRAKEDSYQGNERVSINVMTVAPLNFADQIKLLESKIAQYANLGYRPDPATTGH
jgi:replication factor A1